MLCAGWEIGAEITAHHKVLASHTHLISAFMFTLFILEERLVIFAVMQAEPFARIIGFIMKLFCIIKGNW